MSFPTLSLAMVKPVPPIAIGGMKNAKYGIAIPPMVFVDVVDVVISRRSDGCHGFGIVGMNRIYVARREGGGAHPGDGKDDELHVV